MPSKIEWTDETWNFVTGCKKVSPGCQRCYMYREYPRLKAMGVPGYQDAPDVPVVHPGRLERPLTWRRPRRIFVNSMSDTFQWAVPDLIIDRAFEVMRACPQHQFQVLTKRPGRAHYWWATQTNLTVWPENVWLGVSVEDQLRVDQLRLRTLGRLPAPVRFLSVEPLLGPVDLSGRLEGIAWVIVGGESGPGARPMNPEWVRYVRDACAEAGVPFFFKQWGGERDKRGGDKAVLDGRLHHAMPAKRGGSSECGHL